MGLVSKIFLGTAIIVAGGYYFSKKKAATPSKTPAADSLNTQVAKALSRFSEASPIGVTGGIAPDSAQVAKGSAYLNDKLTVTQKEMFIDYSNEFMNETEKFATTKVDPANFDEQKATDAFMEILVNIQSNLEKKYGKDEADKFMLFMNSFDPKKV